jgi:hypothetical protein
MSWIRYSHHHLSRVYWAHEKTVASWSSQEDHSMVSRETATHAGPQGPTSKEVEMASWNRKKPYLSEETLRSIALAFVPCDSPVEHVSTWLKIAGIDLDGPDLHLLERLHCEDLTLLQWRVDVACGFTVRGRPWK